MSCGFAPQLWNEAGVSPFQSAMMRPRARREQTAKPPFTWDCRPFSAPSSPLAATSGAHHLRAGIVVCVSWGKEFYMKIAVACDGLRTSSHAARCGSFMCYTVNKGVITDCRNLPNMGVTSHEAAQLVSSLGFDAIITKGIDMDMAEELCASGIEVVAGVDGTSREVVESYVTETLMGSRIALPCSRRRRGMRRGRCRCGVRPHRREAGSISLAREHPLLRSRG